MELGVYLWDRNHKVYFPQGVWLCSWQGPKRWWDCCQGGPPRQRTAEIDIPDNQTLLGCLHNPETTHHPLHQFKNMNTLFLLPHCPDPNSTRGNTAIITSARTKLGWHWQQETAETCLQARWWSKGLSFMEVDLCPNYSPKLYIVKRSEKEWNQKEEEGRGPSEKCCEDENVD